jgi:hypothetical protein
MMIAKLHAAAGSVFLLVLAAGAAPQAQQPTYERFSSGEIIQGYVPDGEWVETSGHFWISPSGIFLNFNLPSAMAPLLIDVANVAPDSVSQLRAECSASRQFDGGCPAVVRGQVGLVGNRKGIMAREIEILPK